MAKKVAAAWDTLSMDFITLLPTTSNNKTSVLMIVDSLSKRVRLIPTRDNVTAEGVAKLFFDFIVSQFALPRCIVDDQDTKIKFFLAKSYEASWHNLEDVHG
jgi:hypothetical protein